MPIVPPNQAQQELAIFTERETATIILRPGKFFDFRPRRGPPRPLGSSSTTQLSCWENELLTRWLDRSVCVATLHFDASNRPSHPLLSPNNFSLFNLLSFHPNRVSSITLNCSLPLDLDLVQVLNSPHIMSPRKELLLAPKSSINVFRLYAFKWGILVYATWFL